MIKAFTLVETVVAVGIFAILATIGSLLLFGALRGSKKASAISLVRTEGVFAMDSMTSSLRYAHEITGCSATSITFDDITYTCDGGKISSNSASLTSARVNVDSCTISCTPTPPKQKLSILVLLCHAKMLRRFWIGLLFHFKLKLSKVKDIFHWG